MKKIAVLSGYGINCNEETALAFELAARKLGAEERVATHQVHVNDLIRGQQELSDFSMLTIPGGFLHGDDISAGKILASKLR
ncbi:MAG: phosphoribosylformylglycinamidine synthase subunit PurQ, partial [Candidatus Bipolaricaulota bacterium]